MALHENLQQLLVAAKLEVAHMQRIATDAGLRASVQQVERILDDCLAESHSVTVQLSPPVLYDGGLVPALEWLGRQMQREHDLMVIIEADGKAEPVDEDVRVLLF
jgi:signal transduction histidine kinase